MMGINRKDAVRELWYRGILSYKLHPFQQKMVNSYISLNKEITVFACSRRFGKSFVLCLLAIEQCIKKNNSVVKYVCPKKDQVKKIIAPIVRTILEDCPPELKPEWKENDKMYLFPNGSQIQIAGTDNGHHETLRGGFSDLWIVDEAGFCDELSYVVNSILAPTSDTTGGRGIIASTPAKTAEHEFNTKFYYPYERNGELIKYTIYDNPMIDGRKIDEIIARYAKGVKDPEFQREYLCEVIPDSDTLIIPEFTQMEKKIIQENYARPPFYDSYVSMDIGVKDMTVVLFAYYDFIRTTIVIEDEFIINGKDFRTDRLAEEIKKKEEQVFTHPLTKEFKPPYLRVADNNNLVLLNDLSFTYKMDFMPTRKDNKDAALNELRVRISSGKVIINPRCKTLIYDLKYGSWNKKKDSFARNELGHSDSLDSLIYLSRNILTSKNPYPAGYNITHQDKFLPKYSKHSDSEEFWVNMFKSRKSLSSK